MKKYIGFIAAVALLFNVASPIEAGTASIKLYPKTDANSVLGAMTGGAEYLKERPDGSFWYFTIDTGYESDTNKWNWQQQTDWGTSSDNVKESYELSGFILGTGVVRYKDKGSYKSFNKTGVRLGYFSEKGNFHVYRKVSEGGDTERDSVDLKESYDVFRAGLERYVGVEKPLNLKWIQGLSLGVEVRLLNFSLETKSYKEDDHGNWRGNFEDHDRDKFLDVDLDTFDQFNMYFKLDL